MVEHPADIRRPPVCSPYGSDQSTTPTRQDRQQTSDQRHRGDRNSTAG
jgi:hypothetical protein